MHNWVVTRSWSTANDLLMLHLWVNIIDKLRETDFFIDFCNDYVLHIFHELASCHMLTSDLDWTIVSVLEWTLWWASWWALARTSTTSGTLLWTTTSPWASWDLLLDFDLFNRTFNDLLNQLVRLLLRVVLIVDLALFRLDDVALIGACHILQRVSVILDAFNSSNVFMFGWSILE